MMLHRCTRKSNGCMQCCNVGTFPLSTWNPRHRTMPGRRPSVDRDGNPSGFDSRLLRNINLQDAIGVARLDRLSLRSDRQSNSAQKRAGNALDVFDAGAVPARGNARYVPHRTDNRQTSQILFLPRLIMAARPTIISSEALQPMLVRFACT